MNVLHVIDSCDGMYGAESMVLDLVTEQKDSAATTPFLLGMGSMEEQEKPIEREARNRGINVDLLRTERRFSLDIARSLYQFGRSQHIDIIHSHSYKSNILLSAIRKDQRMISVISTVHGSTVTSFASKIWLYSVLDRLALRRMDGVVFVKAPDGTGLGRESKRQFVVENGIAVRDLTFDDSDPLIRQIKDFCREGFSLCTIGRLSREKGHLFLLQALSTLVAGGASVRLVIIGEGEQRDILDRYVRKNALLKHVLFVGYTEKAFRLLRLFDCMVLPSLTEGLPIVLLEAMQAGTPVIASGVGGIPALLGNGRYGLLTKPKSPVSLRDAIECLRTAGIDINSMAREARKTALDRYSSRRMAKDYLTVYNDVLKAS